VRVQIDVGFGDAVTPAAQAIDFPPLLDFPALRDGQEVYLCWREGEADITHWHPLHTGIRGRQPLEGDTASWEWCS
jgi:hypothetical protein